MSVLPTPYYERHGIVIYNADCRDILPLLEPNSVDLVLTDPPFNSPPETKQGGTTGRLKKWLREDGFTYYDNDALLTDEQFHDFFTVVLEDISRIAATGSHLYWFTTRYSLAHFEAYLSDPLYRFTLRNLLVWNKMHMGMGYYWRHQAEYIWFLTKGKTNRYVQGDSNILEVKRNNPAEMTHPHEKPVALYAKLITASGASNMLDPFMGTGASLIAAMQLGIPAIGIEIEERWCEVAAKRLQQEVLAL